jgi:UDP-N-acetylglucosamine/UDP-N-acetylgalactosamine diphosphorylase
MNDDARLMADLEAAGQEHLVKHLSTLDAEPRARLVRQLGSFDYALVRDLAARARSASSEGGDTQVAEFEPSPVTTLDQPRQQVAEAVALGEAAIRRGEVAAFVVAGGQGSRLGFDGPKGCYPIGPVSERTLFQIHAEKLLACSRRYDVVIPLYAMTSTANDAAVRKFFSDNDFFGLGEDNVMFCVQRMLPAFDTQGRFLLDAPDHVFENPDGHGGAYFALQRGGALDDMERRGIRCISYYQVDNPMVPVIDPRFIGEHLRSGSEMSSKVLRKCRPLEKLGVFGEIDGATRVVEYSEIPDALQHKTLPDGSLKYAFGSIAIHIIDVAFARRMAGDNLPFHLARKSIPYLGPDGERVQPDDKNGVKFERFVFDGVPLARNPLILEVCREDEFAPVKNPKGEDSPETARAAMTAQYVRWLREAGVAVPDGVTVEISPLFALDAAELSAKARDLRVVDGVCLR